MLIVRAGPVPLGVVAPALRVSIASDCSSSGPLSEQVTRSASHSLSWLLAWLSGWSAEKASERAGGRATNESARENLHFIMINGHKLPPADEERGRQRASGRAAGAVSELRNDERAKKRAKNNKRGRPRAGVRRRARLAPRDTLALAELGLVVARRPVVVVVAPQFACFYFCAPAQATPSWRRVSSPFERDQGELLLGCQTGTNCCF